MAMADAMDAFAQVIDKFSSTEVHQLKVGFHCLWDN
jgi:hypothetical protein